MSRSILVILASIIFAPCIFLSPVVNMKVIIDNMMLWSNTTEEKFGAIKEFFENK